jgi:hypothetical protein
MQKLLNQIKGNRGTKKPLHICVRDYMIRNNYLNFSEINKHAENLFNYGFMKNNERWQNAMYEFFDKYADELLIHPRLILKSDRRELNYRSLRKQTTLY